MDLMNLQASLSLDSSEYEKGLGFAEKKAGSFSKMMKVGAAAVMAAATAVGALVKKSVDAYGEYEQLTGGIRKLYGEAADDMMSYAEKAYMTAGMSTNAYMQNVTGFSAALLNSLDGDSKEAAKIADMAMQDIADNANTFGKYTVEELSQVYQALAKGQYQTLDNLMLGYGGSKEGMQQLIDHANELAKAQGEAGDLTIGSYADIVKAIHLVQDEMNITGTTANEAAGTIQGSLAMTKAAWENLLTGFADPDADIGALVQNVMTSAGQAAENLVPAIMQAINGISEGLAVVLPQMMQKIPEMIQNMGVPLIQTGAEMVASIAKGAVEAFPQMVTVITDLIGNLTESLGSALPSVLPAVATLAEQLATNLTDGFANLLTGGMDFLTALVDGITAALPTLTTSVVQIIANVVTGLAEHLPEIVESGINLIMALATGFLNAIPGLIASLPKIITAIWDVFVSTNWLSLGMKILTGIIRGILSIASKLPEAIKNIVKAAKDTFKNTNWKELGKSLLKKLILGVKSDAHQLANAVKDLAQKAKEKFKSIDWKSVGKNIINGIVGGLAEVGSKVVDFIVGLGKKALDKVKNFLGISSPSKVFRDQVGKNIGLGVAAGVEESTPDAVAAVERMAADMEAAPFSVLSVPDSFVNGSSMIQEQMTVEFGNQIAELGEYIREGMAEAVEGITITLDKRTFGRATRKAMA